MTTKKVLQTTEGLVIGKDGSVAVIIEVVEAPGASGKSQTVAEGSIAIGAAGSPVAGQLYRKPLAGAGTDKWTRIIDQDDLDNALLGDKLFDPKDSVRYATTAALDVTAAGAKAGKTLTAKVNGAFTVDGNSPVQDERILVKDGSVDNGLVDAGIYTVTTVGDAGTPYVLTRAGDADDDIAKEVTAGANVYVEEGVDNANSRYVLVGGGDVDVDVDPQNWTLFLKLGDLSAIQGELDATQVSAGSAVNADGTFNGYSATNHIDTATSLTNADELLDAEIGADPTANTRTNNPIVPGNSLNSNIEALDDAVGSDAQLTPETRSVGQVALSSSVYAKLDSLDAYAGADSQLTPESRTSGPVTNSQTTKQLADSLDSAIGADPTPVARTTSPISVANSSNANIDAVDAAIGSDTTINNYTDVNNTINQNLDALDSQTKSNTDRLDEVATKVSTTTSGGNTLQTVDGVLASLANHFEWEVLVRESASNEKVASITIGATHDRTSTTDATDVDSYDVGLLEIQGSRISQFDYDVIRVGAGASQEIQLQLQSANALDVRIVRKYQSF